MEWVEWIAMGLGLMGCILFALGKLKLTASFYLAASVAWIVAGVHHDMPSLWIESSIFAIFEVAAIIRYRKHKCD